MLIDFREREGEREKEKVLCEREHPSVAFLTCPDKELNPHPFYILDNQLARASIFVSYLQ